MFSILKSHAQNGDALVCSFIKMSRLKCHTKTVKVACDPGEISDKSWNPLSMIMPLAIGKTVIVKDPKLSSLADDEDSDKTVCLSLCWLHHVAALYFFTS